MNIENLITLATYLEQLPANYSHFHMRTFYYEHGFAEYEYPNQVPAAPDCGTIACAIGHGPAAGLPAKDGEGWLSYSKRVFDTTPREWDWCFSADWQTTDNTPQGAAKRIRHLIEFGLPDNARAQQWGCADYLFNEEVQPV